jgi:hypothetical protein
MLFSLKKIIWIIRNYFEQLYANKLETYKTWTNLWAHKTLNKQIICNEIELIICLLTKKGPGTDGFTIAFYLVLFFFLMILEFELRISYLLGRHSTA